MKSEFPSLEENIREYNFFLFQCKTLKKLLENVFTLLFSYWQMKLMGEKSVLYYYCQVNSIYHDENNGLAKMLR